MSGGSYDYMYRKVQDMADTLADDKDQLRRVFAKHLELVADACHDIEWVDSDDYGPGDDIEAIKKALGKDADKLVLDVIVEDAKQILNKLSEAIKTAGDGKEE